MGPGRHQDPVALKGSNLIRHECILTASQSLLSRSLVLGDGFDPEGAI